jgi:hypothetical protein
MYSCGQLLLTASQGVFLGLCLQARDIRRAEATASSHFGQHRASYPLMLSYPSHGGRHLTGEKEREKKTNQRRREKRFEYDRYRNVHPN